MGYTYDKGRTLKGAVVNEMLFGQTQTACARLMEDLEVDFNFNLDDYYLCLTGISKQVYAPRFGKDLDDYFVLYGQLETLVTSKMRELGIVFDAAIIKYDGSKHICYLMTPPADDDSAIESAARFVHESLVALYETCWELDPASFVCITALSGRCHGFDMLTHAFKNVTSMTALAFYLADSLFITAPEYKNLRIPVSTRELSRRLKSIEGCIVRGNLQELDRQIDLLFCHDLRYAFSRQACEAALAGLRDILDRYGDVYLVEGSSDLERLSLDGRGHLQEVRDDARELLRACAAASTANGREVGTLAMEAIRYIREHSTSALTVSAIAKVVNVSEGYLGRVFNREVGESIPSFIRRARLSNAEHLLRTTDLSIAEISGHCGFSSVPYFNMIFKKHTGFTPTQYRKDHPSREVRGARRP